MASATFKEMCLDTSRTMDAAGPFWAAITGCRYAPSTKAGEPGDVLGDQEGMGIAICAVPEDKSAKNRVHLDVSVGSLDEITALGGSIGEAHEHWTVCADPEGNEFCAFVREGELPHYRTFEIVVDSAEPEAVARWWAARFGVAAENADRQGDPTPFWWIAGAPGFPTAGPFFAMVFAPVPEPKTVKNRMHWDLYGDVDDFLAAGARKLWEVPGRTRPIAWTVLADPEGNEFCVFPAS